MGTEDDGSRTPPQQSHLHIDGSDFIVLEEDEVTGYVTTYSCQELVLNNVVTPIQVDFFYDLEYSSDVSPEEASQVFQFLLLELVAKEWGLDDGDACISPPLEGIHLVEASSKPDDEPNELFDKCFELSPASGRSCVSFKGFLTGKVSGSDDVSLIVDFIANSIDKGIVTAGTSMTGAFLGTQIEVTPESGRDKLPTPSRVESSQPVVARTGSDQFTYVGVLLVVALCSAFMGLVFVIFRLRQRRQKVWREEAVMAAKSQQTELDEDVVEMPSQYGLDLVSEGLPEPDEEYQFDLGDSMKMGVMGIYGGANEPSPYQFRRPQPQSDNGSVSDVDSWAQTDATIGSLEIRVALGETSEI